MAKKEELVQLADALKEIRRCVGWPMVQQYMTDRAEGLKKQMNLPFWKTKDGASTEKFMSAHSYCSGQIDELELFMSMVTGIVDIGKGDEGK